MVMMEFIKESKNRTISLIFLFLSSITLAVTLCVSFDFDRIFSTAQQRNKTRKINLIVGLIDIIMPSCTTYFNQLIKTI